MTEHALYVAVRDHRTRPPLGKLSQIYPHQLLVLLMEMWEGESQLVAYFIFFLQSHLIFFYYSDLQWIKLSMYYPLILLNFNFYMLHIMENINLWVFSFPPCNFFFFFFLGGTLLKRTIGWRSLVFSVPTPDNFLKININYCTSPIKRSNSTNGSGMCLYPPYIHHIYARLFIGSNCDVQIHKKTFFYFLVFKTFFFSTLFDIKIS